MNRLSASEQEVLHLLQSEKGYLSPTVIAQRLHPGTNRHSSWASPICKRLQSMRLVERNSQGHYRATFSEQPIQLVQSDGNTFHLVLGSEIKIRIEVRPHSVKLHLNGKIHPIMAEELSVDQALVIHQFDSQEAAQQAFPGLAPHHNWIGRPPP